MCPESYPINSVVDNSAFLIGAGTSILGAIVGFVLTFVGDRYKYKLENDKRKNLLINLLKDEVKENIVLLNKNIKDLENEIAILSQGKAIPVPLGFMLNTSSWELFRLNLELKKDNLENITKLKSIYSAISELNDILSSRKNYKITNGAMSNYENYLKSYNTSIIQASNKIIEQINQLEEWDKLKL